MLNKMMRRSIYSTVLAAAALLAAVPMQAQSTTQGGIAGAVEDATDAIVPNAMVMVRNDGTNANTQITADSSGYFKAPLLEPGTYTVTITAPSFGTYTGKGVVVQVGQLTELMPHLAAGSAEQAVTVSAEALTLNYESPDLSSVLTSKAIEDIPVQNRRWSSLALTTPGVVADSSGFGLVSVRGIEHAGHVATISFLLLLGYAVMMLVFSIRVEPSRLKDELMALREFMMPECEIYLYCSCIRDTTSVRIAHILQQANCRTQVIEGGLRAWIKAGGPVEPVPAGDVEHLPQFS